MKYYDFFPAGALTLNGPVGRALVKNIRCRLETLDYALMAEPFRLRSENDGAWRCEFWGKNLRGAILAWHMSPSDELLKKIRSAVDDILSAQTPDGCISSYPADQQISSWDVWGRKYVLLALLRYCRLISPEQKVLQACCRLVDHLISQLTGEKADLRTCGMHDGLASCSIAGAIIELYGLTGEKRFLDFARSLLESGCSLKENVFDAALNGVAPKDIGNAKAYELSSCFEAASAFFRITGEERYKLAVEKYFNAIVEKEIFVTGTAGGKDDCGEYWFDGVKNQASADPGCGLGETCVTVTYMRFCEAVAALNEYDPKPFDEMENSLYNALLGAMNPDGKHWTHANPTPLTGGGWKASPPDQIERWFNTPFDGHDCCRAQGPEGLAFGAAHAVLKLADGIMVNFYEDFILHDSIATGEKYTVENRGNYPASGESSLFFRMEQPLERKVVLRIPAWADECEVTLNGKNIPVCAGKYCIIDRLWSDGDRLCLDFHPAVRVIRPAGTSGVFALKYGPVVLAAGGRDAGDPDPAKTFETSGGCGTILNFRQGDFTVCDYASAGMGFSPDDPVKVFFKEVTE